MLRFAEGHGTHGEQSIISSNILLLLGTAKLKKKLNILYRHDQVFTPILSVLSSHLAQPCKPTSSLMPSPLLECTLYLRIKLLLQDSNQILLHLEKQIFRHSIKILHILLTINLTFDITNNISRMYTYLYMYICLTI